MWSRLRLMAAGLLRLYVRKETRQGAQGAWLGRAEGHSWGRMREAKGAVGRGVWAEHREWEAPEVAVPDQADQGGKPIPFQAWLVCMSLPLSGTEPRPLSRQLERGASDSREATTSWGRPGATRLTVQLLSHPRRPPEHVGPAGVYGSGEADGHSAHCYARNPTPIPKEMSGLLPACDIPQGRRQLCSW